MTEHTHMQSTYVAIAKRSLKPNRKVASGGLAGGISAILIWAIAGAEVEVSPEIAAAATAVLMALVSYLIPEKKG